MYVPLAGSAPLLSVRWAMALPQCCCRECETEAVLSCKTWFVEDLGLGFLPFLPSAELHLLHKPTLLTLY